MASGALNKSSAEPGAATRTIDDGQEARKGVSHLPELHREDRPLILLSLGLVVVKKFPDIFSGP
eukprot:4155642-Prorocentrum_lima.AAC.1